MECHDRQPHLGSGPEDDVININRIEMVLLRSGRIDNISDVPVVIGVPTPDTS